MKKGTILSVINEAVENQSLVNMNEDSYFDGHKFVDYGKNIKNISFMMPSTDTEEYSLDKDKLVIKWGAKFNFRNSGVESVDIAVLDLEGSVTSTVNGQKQVQPINFGEYKIEAIKEKDVEHNDLRMSVLSIEIDAETKTVNVVITI